MTQKFFDAWLNFCFIQVYSSNIGVNVELMRKNEAKNIFCFIPFGDVYYSEGKVETWKNLLG